MKAVLFNDTSFDHHLGCQLVMRQIYHLCGCYDMQVMTVSPVKHKWQKDRKLRNAVNDADLVIVNGEGTLHSDNRRALRLINIADFCQELDKPVFLINALYHNNSEEMHRSAKKFTKIYVRDLQSQEELRQEGVDASYCPDLTLSIIPHVRNKPNTGLLVIDSNSSGVTLDLYHKYQREKDNGAIFRTMLSKPKIQKGKNRKDFLFQSYLDRFVFKLKRRKSLKKKVFSSEDVSAIHRERNVNTMLECFAGSTGVITGRFHGICYALVTQTPFLACAASTNKVQSLLREVGLDGRFITLDELQQVTVHGFSESELKKVSAFTDKSRRLANEMFSQIAIEASGFAR
jgi:polysaccharide pyruvyl transferase WcaK-like protein